MEMEIRRVVNLARMGEGSYVIGRVQRSLLGAEILLILVKVVILWVYTFKNLTTCILTICAVYSL